MLFQFKTGSKSTKSLKKLKNKLFTIATKQPNSTRYYQARFDGFGSDKDYFWQKFLYFFYDFSLFIKKYFKRKSRNLVTKVKNVFIGAVAFSRRIKEELVRKLIWSRGKLGRPVATIFVMLVAFIIFTFGKVLDKSKYVVSKEVNYDYLSSVSDIIPQQNTAITLIPESRKQSEAFAYVIQGGDTLSGIGNKFKISVDAIRYVNGLKEGDVLNVGDELTIPPITGLIHTVESGDTLTSIAKKYDVPPQAVADFNYILDTGSLAIGTELVIPDAKVPEVVIEPIYAVTPVEPSYSAQPATPSAGFCVYPTSGSIITTQNFTWYHNGVDLAISFGQPMPPIYSCRDGVVTRAGWDPWGLGLHVRIDHGNGYETIYGHLSQINVGVGQRVGRGAVIGTMGNTGRSTGPHLHFMVDFNGIPQNPFNYL